jgi:predicted DNA-binding protein with PD1-like motif
MAAALQHARARVEARGPLCGITRGHMLVTESRSVRRLVGRLDRGVNLFDAVLEVCREHHVRTAELRALGSLETVEVAEYDQAHKVWKPSRGFVGGMEILHLVGNVSERAGQLALHCHASLMRDRDNGVEVLGGHVVAARVFALEFVLEVFDDLILRRAVDAATGLPLWAEAIALAAAAGAPAEAAAEADETPLPSPVAPPTPLPAAASIRSASASWSDVAAASARRSASPADEADDAGEESSLEPGDVLIHPTFGRCEVQRIEGSYEFAHVRLKNGRLVRLSLDILKVAPAGTEGGHRVFRARID